MLFKPLEWAFDTGRLTFVWNSERNSFVARILEPRLRLVALLDKLAELGVKMKEEALLGVPRTFGDIDGRSLVLPQTHIVWRRCLCFHANLTRDGAVQKGWLNVGEFEFDDFWSDGTSAVQLRVLSWLDSHTLLSLREVDEGREDPDSSD